MIEGNDKKKREQSQFQLDEIADDFLMRRRKGETPSIASYQQEHPELAGRIADLLQTVQFVDSMVDETCDGIPLRSSLQDEREQIPESLGGYEIIQKLGEGGMGTVYRARHRKLNRVVALKTLPAKRLSQQDIARFEREMASTGQLNHRNIVVAHDAGEVDGQHYLAMELLDGFDLAKISNACSPMNVATACELIRQAALGLHYAHKHSTVHRDVKPSNLMLTRDGVVKVLDLGLAHCHNATDGKITTTGQVMGTIDYMAPEQCENSSADIRADIYGLAATLYKLLSGVPPYAGSNINTTLEKLAAMAKGDPPSITKRRFDLPKSLTQIIDRAISRNPKKRPASAHEFANLIANFANPADLNKLIVETEKHSETRALQDTIVPNQALLDTSRASQFQDFRASPKPARAKVITIALVAIGLIVLLPFAIPAVMSLTTDDGTITIETKGGETEVVFDGQHASFIDPIDQREVKISIDKELGLLVFEKEGFKALGKSYELANKNRFVSIRFEPKKTELSSAEKELNSRDEIVRWAIDNGLREINRIPTSPATPISDSMNIHDVSVFNNPTGNAAKVLKKLREVAELHSVDIHANNRPDAAFIEELCELENLSGLHFHSPCTSEDLLAIPLEVTAHVHHFGIVRKEKPPNDQTVKIISERYPKLTHLQLTAAELTPASISSIQSLKRIENLALLKPTREVQKNLGLLTSVTTLSLTNRLPSSLDFSNLPPNLSTLWLSKQDLGDKELKALERYPDLRFISLDNSHLDQRAAEQFLVSHPTCEFCNFTPKHLQNSILRWAFSNGVEEVHCDMSSGKNLVVNRRSTHTPSNDGIAKFSRVIIENSPKTCELVRRLEAVAPVTNLAINGSHPLCFDLIQEMGQLSQLNKLDIYCPTTLETIAKLSVKTRQRIHTLGLFCRRQGFEATDLKVQKLLPLFPRLKTVKLRATHLSKTSLRHIQESGATSLVLTEAEPSILDSLHTLSAIKTLQLSYELKSATVEAFTLPPNLVELWFDGTPVTKGHLEVFARCKSLKRLTPRNSRFIDMKALKDFRAARPDCEVDLTFANLSKTKPTARVQSQLPQ